MNDDQKNAADNTRRKPVVIQPAEVAKNPNPQANENIRVRTDEPKKNQSSESIGSEITDGEDA